MGKPSRNWISRSRTHEAAAAINTGRSLGEAKGASLYACLTQVLRRRFFVSD